MMPSSFDRPIARASTILSFLVWSVATHILLLTPVAVVNAYDWTCNLYCYNGGSCRHGHGKFGSYSSIADGITDAGDSSETVPKENGMFCVCPVGYTGLQCEIKFVVCGQDDHTCFNGSNCKKERAGLDGTIYYRCECDADESVLEADYASKFCEHISTTFCDGDGNKHGGTSYCTNGGKCKKKDSTSKKHVGCDCAEGWEGDHCETAIESLSMTQMLVSQATNTKNVGLIVGLVVGSVVGVILLLVAKEKYVDRPRRARNAARRGRNRHQELGTRRLPSTREII